jgi:hypothetical protein
MLKHKALPLLLFLIAMLAVAAIFGPWVREQRHIDSCLDAGNSWDFAAKSCLTPPEN